MSVHPMGERVRRNEDPRLLTGKALFVGAVGLPGLLHVAFLRSPHAHARLGRIDASRALALPGVVAVYTAADLGAYWRPGPLLVPPPPIPGSVFNQRTQVPLAKDKVRHLGEPVALVVAESRYLAERAVEAIELALQLERPVKWIEDRAENFVATTHERGQIHDAEIALDADGRILGIRDTFLHDTGAYDPYGLTVPLNSQCTLLGPYRVPAYLSEFRAVFTNKTIVTPYRGAGRQHGVFVIERLMDLAARELRIDGIELRRRNFLKPDEFPHDHVIIYQDFAPLYYDSCNFDPVLAKTLH